MKVARGRGVQKECPGEGGEGLDIIANYGTHTRLLVLFRGVASLVGDYCQQRLLTRGTLHLLMFAGSLGFLSLLPIGPLAGELG